MGRKEQKNGQDGTWEKPKKKKITVFRVLAAVVGVIVAIYLFISLQVFYQFVKLLLTDPDAATREVEVPVSAVTQEAGTPAPVSVVTQEVEAPAPVSVVTQEVEAPVSAVTQEYGFAGRSWDAVPVTGKVLLAGGVLF